MLKSSTGFVAAISLQLFHIIYDQKKITWWFDNNLINPKLIPIFHGKNNRKLYFEVYTQVLDNEYLSSTLGNT